MVPAAAFCTMFMMVTSPSPVRTSVTITVRLRGGTSHPAAALARGRQPLRFTARPIGRPSDLLPGPPAGPQTASVKAHGACWRLGLLAHDAKPVGDCRGLDPAGDAELRENARDMHADGLGADEQGLPDLRIRLAGGEQQENLAFALGQAEAGQFVSRRARRARSAWCARHAAGCRGAGNTGLARFCLA